MPKVVCSCGAKYKLPDSAIGRKARCKKCGGVFEVRADESSALPPDELLALAGGEAIAVERPPSDIVEAQPISAGVVRYVAQPGEAAARAPGIFRETGALLADIGRSCGLVFRPGNLVSLGVVWVILFLQACMGMLPCLGLIGAIIVTGWYCAFLLNTVESGTQNDSELPSMTLVGGVTEDALIPLGKYLLAWLLAILPFLAVVAYLALLEYTGDMDKLAEFGNVALGNGLGSAVSAGGEMLVVVLALAFGLAFFPMLLLVAAVGGAGAMFRVDLMLRTIIRTIPAYLVVLFVNGLAVAAWIGLHAAAEEAAGRDLIKLLGLKFAVACVLVVVNVIAYRTIGLYYYHCKRRFAWQWE